MKRIEIALALTIMVMAPVSASAQGSVTQFVQDALQTTGDVADRTTTSTKTVSTGSGVTSVTTVTSTNSHPMSSGAMFAILDNRRYELDKIIGDATVRGTISTSQAAELQGKSDHIRLLMLDRGAVLNNQQSLKIAAELDDLVAGVASALKTTALPPLTVVDTTSGTQRIVTDQFGNVIAIEESGPDLYIKTLEGRRLELEASIAAGEASGSIAAQQARNLRAELDRVSQAQAKERSDQFSYITALPLAMSLDYVGHELVQVVPTTSYVPLINGTRFVSFDGRIVMLDDVMVRRAELESKVARLLATGRISARNAAALRSELSKIAVVEKQMRAKGSLTFVDSRELYKLFDRVGSRLDVS